MLSQIKQIHFHPLEVVDRGSETRLQLDENHFLSKALEGLNENMNRPSFYTKPR